VAFWSIDLKPTDHARSAVLKLEALEQP